jgi:hypothetical protein
MTNNINADPLYIKLKDKLKKKYKNNFEDKDDYIIIYHKSMAFYIEPYEGYESPVSVFAGLSYVDTYDMGEVTSYNDYFQIDETPLLIEQDIDDFIEEFSYLVQTCDADKRVTKIMKMLDRINDSIDREMDWDFLNDALRYYFE